MLLACVLPTAGADVSPQCVEAHEWGVSEFDWLNGRPVAPAAARFVYTNAMAAQLNLARVRTKHLYFYGPDTLRKRFDGNPPIPLKIEVQFPQGQSSAWWPQASPFKEGTPQSDLEGADLVWEHLGLARLHSKLQLKPLPEGHEWASARQVESDLLANDREVEKFLFYESREAERPSIAIIPQDRFSEARFLVYNIGPYPIYDVFLVFRRQHQFWVRYYPEVMPIGRHASEERSPPNILCPAVPRFADLDREETSDETEFLRRTQLRLGSILRTDFPPPESVYHGQRSAAQPQGNSDEYRLFPLELAALQKSWNHSFFGEDGFTILYRENRTEVDSAVPLRIYTDDRHFISLSRCSLVVHRHIDLARIRETSEALRQALARIKPEDDSSGATRDVQTCFDKEPLGTLTELLYLRQTGQLPAPFATLDLPLIFGNARQ